MRVIVVFGKCEGQRIGDDDDEDDDDADDYLAVIVQYYARM